MFKKDNKQDIKNYRPITSDRKGLWTVTEQTADIIYRPYVKNNLTGYRKDQNCEPSLTGLVERWKQAVGNRNVLGVLSTDMSKAFHSLYPPLLINKLRKYDFSNNSLTLMRSYFTNRNTKLGSVKKQQAIGTRPREVFPRYRPSGSFSGTSFKTIYISPPMKIGYSCTRMTTNCFQWRREPTRRKSF